MEQLTSTFIEENLVVENSVYFPIGTIIQCHPESNVLPNSNIWVKCDGDVDLGTNFNTPTNKVPNLSDERFLMGFSHASTTASSDGSNVMVNHKHSTNSTDLNLSCNCTTSGSVGSLGTCNVSLASGATNNTGAHNHSYLFGSAFCNFYDCFSSMRTIFQDDGIPIFTSSNGNHSHTASGTTNIAHSHSHSNPTVVCTTVTGSIGDGANDVSITENRPQYFTVHYYIRLV